jgi:biotin carboxyl carrier protein
MKRKFKVTVDGETFLVEVEEVLEEGMKPRAGAEKPRRTESVAPEKVETTAVAMGVVLAPLPGVVSELRVAEGDEVKAGSVLLVLEAMKMENEIYAPADGVVSEIHVEVGKQVGRGDRLVLIS